MFASLWSKLQEKFKEKSAAWFLAVMTTMTSGLAVTIWSWLKGLTLPELIMLVWVTLAISAICAMVVWTFAIWLSEVLARQLTIQFSPDANLVSLPEWKEGTASQAAWSQSRIRVWNRSANKPVKNMKVKIESLVPVGAADVTGRTQWTAPQFTGMPLHIERGSQGMELPSHEGVEVFVAEWTGREEDRLYFRTSESCTRYWTAAGDYVVTISATGENIPEERRTFFVSTANRGLTFRAHKLRPRPN